MLNRSKTQFAFTCMALLTVLGVGMALRSQADDQDQIPRVNQSSDHNGLSRTPFDYHDDRDSRNLAEVDLKIATNKDNSHSSLDIRISAVGPDVDPIPGYRGVHGANRYTAEELQLILSGKHAVEVHTWRRDDPNPKDGHVRSGRRGRIPERRILPDGQIDVSAMTRETYPLDLTINTGVLSRGSQQTQISIDGIPRLRVSFDFDGHAAHITNFESLGDPDHANTEPLNPKQAALAAGDKKNVKPPKVHPAPVQDAEWDARDLEGKWVLFQSKSVEQNFVPAAWVQYLVKRKDYEFLEWIGLYRIDSMKQYRIGWALANADAPQWIRAAAWSRRTPQAMGHGESQARSILRTHDPAVAFSWLDKNKKLFIDSNNRVKRDYDYLAKRGLDKQDLKKVSPPLNAAEVFKYLDAPAELHQFGSRKKAQAGHVYEHQVVRAIDGMVNSGFYDSKWTDKVIALVGHKNDKVRQAAVLAFTYFHRSLDKTKYPLAILEKTIDNPDELNSIRQSACMAYSFFNHPAAFTLLHRIASDPKHTAWRTAISRLGDRRSEFTLDYLKDLTKKDLDVANEELWIKIESKIRASVASRKKSRTVQPTTKQISALLEQAAWAEITNDPTTSKLTDWAVTHLGQRMTTTTLRYAKEVHETYEPDWTTGEQKKQIQERVRELASNVIEESKNQQP